MALPVGRGNIKRNQDGMPPGEGYNKGAPAPGAIANPITMSNPTAGIPVPVPAAPVPISGTAANPGTAANLAAIAKLAGIPNLAGIAHAGAIVHAGDFVHAGTIANPIAGAQAPGAIGNRDANYSWQDLWEAMEMFLLSPFHNPHTPLQWVKATLVVTMPVAIGVGVATGQHQHSLLSGLIAAASIISVPTLIMGTVAAARAGSTGSILP